MSEGHTNVGIARRLYVSERTVETPVTSILTMLGISDSDDDHRGVLAVITYLQTSTINHPGSTRPGTQLEAQMLDVEPLMHAHTT